MQHPHQSIIDQCDVAARNVIHLLSMKHSQDTLDLILDYNEWRLGLEFIIDWLCDDNQEISVSQLTELKRYTV